VFLALAKKYFLKRRFVENEETVIMKARLMAVAVLVMLGISAVGVHGDGAAVKETPVVKDMSVADPRVAMLLKEQGTRYMVDDVGDYLVRGPSWVSNQVRMVWINSRTTKWYTTEIREIWSIAYRAPGRISLEDAKNFLVRNSIIKVGAWQIVESIDSYSVIFAVKVDANQTAATLDDMITFVYVTADGVALQISRGKLLPPGGG
jgi:hypothetical protein